MSTELRDIRKKRTSSDATSSITASDGDHRKRRRNRTTQSCLNCHTSKRMCDRKRPCGRCTQLGLTGLCVYEVDDPSRQNDVQDESSRLRQRVAELEGIIRELKNKPHPRWTKSGCSPGEEFEKCHEHSRSRSTSGNPGIEARYQSNPPQPFSPNLNANLSEDLLDKNTQPLLTETLIPSSLSPLVMGTSSSLSTPAYFDINSPLSASSTDIMTPTEEPSKSQVAVTVEQHFTDDMDLASLFMPYSDLLACGKGGHVDSVPPMTQYIDPRSTKYGYGQFGDGHCGCLGEISSYNVVLELSLRLRKAADILSHSANHYFSNGCPLNQRILELDAFATTALGNMTTSPNDIRPIHLRSRAKTAPSSSTPLGFPAGDCAPVISSPSAVRGLRSWGVGPSVFDTTGLCDESFMTWGPSRRA